MKWYAIPLRADGTESLGTIGVLTGEYKCKETFLRYRVRPHGDPGKSYQLYTKDSDWRKQGTVTLPAGAR